MNQTKRKVSFKMIKFTKIHWPEILTKYLIHVLINQHKYILYILNLLFIAYQMFWGIHTLHTLHHWKTKQAADTTGRWKGVDGSVPKIHKLDKEEKKHWDLKVEWKSCFLSSLLPCNIWTIRGVCRQRLYLWTGSQCRHEELHLVHKVSTLHFAPVDLFARPPEVTPLGLLYDVALWQLFALVAGELDQNFAPTLWAVTHWKAKEMKIQSVIC